MRVCMVHYSDFHLDSRIQRQARALAQRGDEVHLVCLSPDGSERVGDGSIHLHGCGREKVGGAASRYVRGYGGFVARAGATVARLDRRLRFDLVETHNMPDAVAFAALAPRLRGVPVVLNVHDLFPELFQTTFGRPAGHPAVRVVAAQERASIRVATATVAVTQEAADALDARGAAATTVVMNSPDEGVFGPPRAPVAPPAAGPYRIVYAGGLAPRFGVDDLVRAVGRLDGRATLRILGGGEGQARLAALAADVAPGVVEVPGPVPFPQIPAELDAAHLGVVPTRADVFTELLLPVKLLEYVHVGLPVVATRLPTVQRYFSDDEVRFCAPGDPEDLAAALEALIAAPDAARAQAAAASRRLVPLAWPRQRARYLALVDRLVAEAAGALSRSYQAEQPHRTEPRSGAFQHHQDPVQAQA